MLKKTDFFQKPVVKALFALLLKYKLIKSASKHP